MGSATDARTPEIDLRSSYPTDDITEADVPRYMIERTFPDGLHIPADDDGAKALDNVVVTNGGEQVTWVHSYVTEDKGKTFCIYDGPNPEAIRTVAERNGLPVDTITQVSVLDPYFYH
jgi:hypothetical protein